ncbi:LLM class flavin-dependent oxidoreductase [Streptomyces litchfieldiae]|uniref:LLM class flavin-dependent oxidoreductase n=1 Tax=Streptomyces litchfieldiae TaxID=3075543 RepID=A0ABU2N112_9ACTN|nr:LLM class flavin-dependent oxidoreductase [Streptomyces sp. DSM 44938]MDT0347598.1 LLM class flavin-dependent oxidoreductase [Streptomyces sp. DSM 44938]
MTDYGHDLRFGSFLTPQHQNARHVVDLAVLSEEAGLDLVTFQDHPYQPAFLDTWTLISWVAARTDRIHLSGNVTNLPLRQPAVLARSVASLDILSGGRIDLGLGAGGFWDAIEAMGGRRLSPGESIQALGEAIDIIRGIWAAEERGALRVDGTFHKVRGAKRGPAPAHDVPIWLGAYKPRMLRLIGEKADGWLPSLGYLSTPTLPEGNAIIDEAAERHGRDPREIRRLLNINGAFGTSTDQLQGPPEQWVEQLLPFVLEDGVSTFILVSDDPRTLQTFGQEVAPALRERVAAERRSADTPTGGVRPAAALAERRAGIDYDGLPAALRERAVEPGDHEFPRVRSTYLWHGSPGLVLRPTTPREVSETLRYARAQDVPLAIRSGGHGISGRSTNDGGIVLDLGALNDVRVLDPERRLVRVGAGARWGEVAAQLAPHGLAISAGDSGDVGVGGLATAGGQGLFGRSYGLTIDHIKGAEVVLADGSLVRADAEQHPDLFWALRGAGANMGVVTSFDIEAAELRDVVFAQFLHDATDTAGFLQAWGEVSEASPRELTAFLILVRQGGRPIAQTYAVWAGDDTERASQALSRFLPIAPVLHQNAQLLPYAAVVAPTHQQHDGSSAFRGHGGLVDHLDDTTASVMSGLLDRRDATYLQVRTVGGAINDVPAEATAYAHRTQNFSLFAAVRPGREERAEKEWRTLPSNGLYLSFESHGHTAALTSAFPPATLDRLRGIKGVYDPENVFRNNFSVSPTAGSVG